MSPVWRRKPRRGAVGWDSTKETQEETLAYLDAFVASRRGVEVYVEPATVVVETSVALVAADGEWTRRRIGSPQGRSGLRQEALDPGLRRCGTGLPAADAGVDQRPGSQTAGRRLRPQELPATSSSSSTRVRTAAPVPPLGV